MSVPNVAEDNPRQEYTLEEMEASTREEPQPKPEDIKTPDGKSLADILEHQRRLEESLKLSESARIALQQAAERPASPAPQPQQPEPQREPLTREKLAEIYQEDPIKAIAMMQDDAIARAAEHFETRLNQLQVGTEGAAEDWAKKEFADEFAVLGKEINAFKAQIPDQSIFTTKKGWEDLVSYVRGQRGNFERYLEHKTGNPPRTPSDARREAEDAAGFSTTSRQRSSIPDATRRLDPTTEAIAENLFPDLTKEQAIAEYIKWANIGVQR